MNAEIFTILDPLYSAFVARPDCSVAAFDWVRIDEPSAIVTGKRPASHGYRTLTTLLTYIRLTSITTVAKSDDLQCDIPYISKNNSHTVLLNIFLVEKSSCMPDFIDKIMNS